MRYFILLFSLFVLPAAWAEDLPPMNQSLIEDGVLAGARGNTVINEAAGTGNRQVNAVAISRAAHGAAQAQASLPQAAAGAAGASVQDSLVGIGPHALSGISGITAINQASGTANWQGNSIAVSIGPVAELAPDTVLSGVTAGSTHLNQAGPSQGHSHTLVVDTTAFQGAHGIVQLNQAGGNDNVSSNHFALRVSGGPTF
jgi:hypothetical protein